MNLIEQLGGYDEAKKCLSTPTARECIKDELRKELLECRRENSIFEAGDVVAEPNLTYPYLYKIYEISGLLIKVENLTNNRKSISFGSDFRHATDEEIKVGYRI